MERIQNSIIQKDISNTKNTCFFTLNTGDQQRRDFSSKTKITMNFYFSPSKFLTILLLILVQETFSEINNACSAENNGSCLSVLVEKKNDEMLSLINTNNNNDVLQKGTILIAPSGLRLELMEKIGLLGENSSECLSSKSDVHHSSNNEIMLRPIDFNNGKVRQGLLLAPSTTTEGEILNLLPPPSASLSASLPPPSLRLSSAAPFFKGLDIAVLQPNQLSTRVEVERDEEFTSDKYKYKISETLYDKGSCGEVWRAKSRARKHSKSQEEPEEEDQEYILKRIFTHRGANVRYSGWREIYFGKLLQGLPNVARFVEYFEVSNNKATNKATNKTTNKTTNQKNHNKKIVDLWLVFVDEGESLRNFLYSQNGLIIEPSIEWVRMRQSGTDTFTVIRDIMYNILQGLQQIHKLKVTHRDIKPSNIVVQRAHSNQEKTILKLVDFGSSVIFIDRETKKQSSFFGNMYGKQGPTTFDMTEKYMPLDLIIKTLFLTINSTVSIVPNALTTAIDLWSAGIILLEMILGTDQPFVIDGRKRLKIQQKIKRKMGTKMKNKMKKMKPKESDIYLSKLVDAVALITGGMEYCILPSSQSERMALQKMNFDTDDSLKHSSSDTDTNTNTNTDIHSNSNFNSNEILFSLDQILPFLDLSDNDVECKDEIILQTLIRRDPLHMGLSLMKRDEVTKLVQLLRGLLTFDPHQRATALEALQFPIFI